MNYDYPEGSYEQRHEIALEHRRYQQGLMYFLANDLRVPEDVRTAMAEWGLAADEFGDNGHWPKLRRVRVAGRRRHRDSVEFALVAVLLAVLIISASTTCSSSLAE